MKLSYTKSYAATLYNLHRHVPVTHMAEVGGSLLGNRKIVLQGLGRQNKVA